MWLVITGSTSGNGLASADRLVAEGAYVFITGRRKGALDAAVTQIGENVIGIRGDVANLADHLNLYDKQFGQALSSPPVKKQARSILKTYLTELSPLCVVLINGTGGAEMSLFAKPAWPLRLGLALLFLANLTLFFYARPDWAASAPVRCLEERSSLLPVFVIIWGERRISIYWSRWH
jgi:NAD(P)-dependent dehydrogenase (short-subunit alcohol dehydrogenase family)